MGDSDDRKVQLDAEEEEETQPDVNNATLARVGCQEAQPHTVQNAIEEEPSEPDHKRSKPGCSFQHHASTSATPGGAIYSNPSPVAPPGEPIQLDCPTVSPSANIEKTAYDEDEFYLHQPGPSGIDSPVGEAIPTQQQTQVPAQAPEGPPLPRKLSDEELMPPPQSTRVKKRSSIRTSDLINQVIVEELKK